MPGAHAGLAASCAGLIEVFLTHPETNLNAEADSCCRQAMQLIAACARKQCDADIGSVSSRVTSSRCCDDDDDAALDIDPSQMARKSHFRSIRRDSFRREPNGTATPVQDDKRSTNYIISPNSPRLLVFHTLIICCILYVLIWVPLELAFDNQTPALTGVNVGIELLFLIDTTIPFFTAYFRCVGFAR